MASDEFDPYLAWLEIPPHRRPPTHYDLLGLAAFESDLTRIEQAALERLERVRRYKVGKREDAAATLERELATAWDCLRDAERKRTYDALLRGSITLPDSPQQTVSETSPSSQADQPQTAVLISSPHETVGDAANSNLIIAELVSQASPPGCAAAGAPQGPLDRTPGQNQLAGNPFAAAKIGPAPPTVASQPYTTALPPKVVPQQRGGVSLPQLAPRLQLTRRAKAMGALSICLTILALVLWQTGPGFRATPGGSDVDWQAGVAWVELVDTAGEQAGHTTLAFVQPDGLALLCLRGREHAIPLRARTPQGATVFFQGGVALDAGLRLVACSTEAAVGAAVRPFDMVGRLPARGATVRLVWCEPPNGGLRVVPGTWLGMSRSSLASSGVSGALEDSPATAPVNQTEPLWEVQVAVQSIPAGAIALNQRQQLVGMCVLTRDRAGDACLILAASDLARLLRAARSQSIEPLDEFRERFVALAAHDSVPREAEREGAGEHLPSEGSEAGPIGALPSLSEPPGGTHGDATGQDGSTPAGKAEDPDRSSASPGSPPGSAGARSPTSPTDPILGPLLEAALAAIDLANALDRFPPLRMDNGWTLFWEQMYDFQTIRFHLTQTDCGQRVEILASDNPGNSASFIGHVRNGKLHGWGAILSAEGTLRFLGEYKDGQLAGESWWFDQQGGLLMWADAEAEGKVKAVVVASKRRAFVLCIDPEMPTVFEIAHTADGLRLAPPLDTARSHQELQELFKRIDRAQLPGLLDAFKTALEERGAALGY
ncbi:MAG: hypothetical protein K6T86_00875 [Pirellulales bacterium]|nr:hypothetical protein [Pirellulales bacterium]